jgi:hypothetical protein
MTRNIRKTKNTNSAMRKKKKKLVRGEKQAWVARK